MFPFGLVDVTTNKSNSYLKLSILHSSALCKIPWTLTGPFWKVRSPEYKSNSQFDLIKPNGTTHVNHL